MYVMKYNMKNLINENDSLKLFRIKNPKFTIPKVFPAPVKEQETWNSFENSTFEY